ncbi:contractile injection system tape measure protein [Aquimarina longa]|uniref:contractile injection system tape measure protein n=1 Tax=Aquimarina longa TaxID=1080221 RepID=UPI00078135C1|nr:contractile injection system tape measure protein [Aquimarina longa]
MKGNDEILIGKLQVDFYAAKMTLDGATLITLIERIKDELISLLGFALEKLSDQSKVVVYDKVEIDVYAQDLTGWFDICVHGIIGELRKEGSEILKENPNLDIASLTSEMKEYKNHNSTIQDFNSGTEQENEQNSIGDPQNNENRVANFQKEDKQLKENLESLLLGKSKEPGNNYFQEISENKEWDEANILQTKVQLEGLYTGVDRMMQGIIYYLKKGVTPWYSISNENIDTTEWRKEQWQEISQLLIIDTNARQRWIMWIAPNIFKNWVNHHNTKWDWATIVIKKMTEWITDPAIGTTQHQEIRRFLTDSCLQLQSLNPLIYKNPLQVIEQKEVKPIQLLSGTLQNELLQYWKDNELPKKLFSNFMDVSSKKIQNLTVDTKEEFKTPDNSEAIKNELVTKEEIWKEIARHVESEQENKFPEEIYTSNAGIVLLHVFLPSLFKQLDWLDKEERWETDKYRLQAVYVIHYLATGDKAPEESSMFVAKLLAGWPEEEPLPKIDTKPIYDVLATQLDELLEAIHQHWKPMDGCTWESLRHDFLQRKAKAIRKDESPWTLIIEKGPFDILLQKLSWSITYIHHPWIENMLIVDWEAA